ncbi:choice-of-anchor A family protein [Arthrobacter sp. Y-9]|uniref:choice-of-anchor A family protein n=1 Tax=Arthrobacter sp. Y-9 TaxID=3039385 RepID=UPI00241C35B0|nr:choice-of-anchor A family protein [Arthrobacter sp. Y-9]WFR84348.1 choice-of-anchor A family protein [Arthrobacter sp. Y-9]
MNRKHLSAVCAAALLSSTTLALAAVPNALAAAQSASCAPRDGMPGIVNEPGFTDNNVALFAGGDYTVTGSAAEAEGLLVIKGDARFHKIPGGIFNVGRVGAGSGIVPTPGETMLAVGGGMLIDSGTTVDVGHGLTDGPKYGGAVHVGGVLDEQGTLTTNGGEVATEMGAGQALSPFATFDQTMIKESADLAALTPTGKAVNNNGTITFTSTAPSHGNVQVFTLTTADLKDASVFVFDKSIPADASIAVNVTGTDAVSIDPLAVGYKGEQADLYSSKYFGEASSRILYNFTQAPSLTLGGGGNFLGSILAPAASADLTASTNGRLYVGHDITTHGTGNESHNYPWTGAPVFDCTPETPVPPTTPPATPSTPSVPLQPATPVTPATATTAPATPPTTPPATPGTPVTPASTPAAPQATSTHTTVPVAGHTSTGELASTGLNLSAFVPATGGFLLVAGVVIAFHARRRRH